MKKGIFKEIPHAKEVVKTNTQAGLRQERLQKDVETKTPARLEELREEFLRELNKSQDGALQITVNDQPQWKGNDTVSFEDFGHHYAAAKLLVQELRQKGYNVQLSIFEDCKVGPFVETDELVLDVSWEWE